MTLLCTTSTPIAAGALRRLSSATAYLVRIRGGGRVGARVKVRVSDGVPGQGQG